MLRRGDAVPELGFSTRAGWVTLDQLRGSRVSITFVQPWMAPCIAQLHRLQRLQERWPRRDVVVVAIVVGASPEETERIARQHGFTFSLSADPHRTASERLGVRAWPTTIAIDEDGHIAAVEMGLGGGAPTAMSRG